MYGYGEDCCCVQGIEYFIDPRLTLPQWDFSGEDVDIPIWQQNHLKAMQKLAEENAQLEEDTDISVTSEQLLSLYVQGLVLTNTGFVHLSAFQLNSYYVKLDSVDTKWTTADTVSLIFSHSKRDSSIIVPVEELGKPVLIPNELLVPGELKIAACTLNNDGTVSSMLTNSITYQIYSPDIKPIDFGKIKDFELYYYFLSSLLKIKKETAGGTVDIKELKIKFEELKARVDALTDAINRLLQELL